MQKKVRGIIIKINYKKLKLNFSQRECLCVFASDELIEKFLSLINEIKFRNKKVKCVGCETTLDKIFEKPTLTNTKAHSEPSSDPLTSTAINCTASLSKQQVASLNKQTFGNNIDSPFDFNNYLMDLENDFETLEEKANKSSNVNEEPAITNIECSKDQENEANKNLKFSIRPCSVRILKLPDEVIHNVVKKTTEHKKSTPKRALSTKQKPLLSSSHFMKIAVPEKISPANVTVSSGESIFN